MKRKLTAAGAALLFAVLMTVPAAAGAGKQAQLPRLVDEADLLTENEESELLEKLDEISERQKLDVVVVTADSIGGQEPAVYADDFYDYNGYGYGDSRDGVLLLVSMEERDWWISTRGYGITAFTDAGLDYLSEQFLPDLGDGDYEAAFTTYAEWCDDFITQARSGKPYDGGNLPKEKLSPVWLFVCLGLGFLFSYLIASQKKSTLTSVAVKSGALNYAAQGSLALHENQDHFVEKRVTSRMIVRERDTSNQGNRGSSTHTSSSGASHGGRGGKF